MPPSPSPPQTLASNADELRGPLPRMTRRVFTDLAIWMTGLGLVMGIAFPFFVLAMGVPGKYVLTAPFFVATIAAGLVVGAANQSLSRLVVRSRLAVMQSKMSKVAEMLRVARVDGDVDDCSPEACSIPVDSEDELGEAASSFNQLVEALAASQRFNSMGRALADTLSSHIELMPLVHGSLRTFERAGGFDASALCLARDGELVTVACNGIEDSARIAASDPVERCYRTLEVVRVELPDEVRLDGTLVSFRPRVIVAYPLHIRMVPIGVLVLASVGEVSDADDELIRNLLPNFAIALNNALGHERLQQVAAIDPLTGLYNRRFGLERLRQEFSRSVRSKEPLGVLLFDIDHFKMVNDTHGHLAGDEVLKVVAESVKRVLREGDTLMRYGGEEFLAVLPGAGEVDLRDLGERIRRVVESAAPVIGSNEIRVTVSLGAISYPALDVIDVEDMIRKADAAMYDAKNGGRNRVSFATL